MAFGQLNGFFLSIGLACILGYTCWQLKELKELVASCDCHHKINIKQQEAVKDRAKDDKKKEGDVKEAEEELPMPDYDEPTKKLIAAADAASSEYNDAVSKYRSINNKIRDIKKFLELDLGLNKEFYPLKGKCFDFTDREYVYTLCPFEKASQRSKHGGSETSLGSWGQWAGPSDSRYTVMKYEGGQNCWSGPDRSATVHLQCSRTNELVSVSEPSRCEYRFVFNTPALCSQKPVPPHYTRLTKTYNRSFHLK